MNLDIPNLKNNIDAESVDNWVQQLESYYFVNQLSKNENITIASLNMLTSMHCWWENLSTKMEREEGPHRHVGEICRVHLKGVLPTQGH